MSNRTYICTGCRTAKRANAAYWAVTEMRCHLCRGELWELCRKWRIPTKQDNKGWRTLEAVIQSEYAARRDFRFRKGTALLESIGRRMASAARLRNPAEAARQLGLLRQARLCVVRQYFPDGTACRCP